MQFAERYPALVDDFYWIAPPSIYGKNWASIERVYNLLGDEHSQTLFLNVLAFRISGDYRSAPLPESQQYFPASLPSWKQPMRLIDCGAYIGEAVENLRDGGYKIEAAICLEPDAKNYRQLVGRIDGIVCLPLAVAETQKQLQFNAEAATSSRLDVDGDCLVQAVSIDEAFFAFAPSLIKMDIEGGEPEALRGAARTIGKYGPGLAIASYHQVEHLWRLPLQISEYLPEVKFELRAHSYNTYDVVLYAQPLGSTALGG
jgi:FkbM family methyltransferase